MTFSGRYKQIPVQEVCVSRADELRRTGISEQASDASAGLPVLEELLNLDSKDC